MAAKRRSSKRKPPTVDQIIENINSELAPITFDERWPEGFIDRLLCDTAQPASENSPLSTLVFGICEFAESIGEEMLRYKYTFHKKQRPKLDNAAIRHIRELKRQGKRQKYIASQLGVSPGALRKALSKYRLTNNRL